MKPIVYAKSTDGLVPVRMSSNHVGVSVGVNPRLLAQPEGPSAFRERAGVFGIKEVRQSRTPGCGPEGEPGRGSTRRIHRLDVSRHVLDDETLAHGK